MTQPQGLHVETDEERDKLLDGLSSLPYHERLTRFLRGSTKHRVTGGVNVVDFRPFYAVTIHHFQRQMAEEIHTLTNNDVTDQQLVKIRDILHHYTNALRDFEFIHANRWNTFFVKDIAASRLDDGPGSKLQAALISELDLAAGDSHCSLYQDTDLLGSFNPKLMQHSTAIGRSLGTGLAQTFSSQERRLHARKASKRFAFAAIGGLIIVVPMLILASGTATTKMQAVISASIFIFAGGVALFSGTEPENLLVVTAAYAAVLVAFIADNPHGLTLALYLVWHNYRDPRLLKGVGRFVQIIMSNLPLGGCNMQGEEPEFTNGDCPFWRYEDRVKDPPNDAQNSLSRDAERIAFSRKPFSQYPFFTGMAMASGCRPKAAGIFVGIGAFSILLGNVRICVGPPRLTSWVGQHVYLTQAGMINLDAEKLASGYIASPKDAVTLRLKVTGGKEEYKIGDDTREGSEEEMLGEQTAGSE